jgi:hypothetical protein
MNGGTPNVSGIQQVNRLLVATDGIYQSVLTSPPCWYISMVATGQGVVMVNTQEKIGMVMLQGCRCRCGHEWLSRDKKEKPRVCPKCKSPNWDRPRKS